jgi:hypothetical protein
MRHGLPKEKASYYPPEMMPFALCAGVLEIVLQQNERAKKLYERMKEYCSLPGCKETFDRLENEIPNGEALVKAIVKKAGYNFKKPPDENNQMVYARGLLSGTKKLVINYAERYLPWVLFRNKRSRDFRKLCSCVNDFIIVGFNNESDLQKGKHKVTAISSNTLVLTIFFRTFADIYKLNLDDWGKIMVFRSGKKTYNMTAVMNGKMSVRGHRSLVGQYRSAGFALKHDEKLNTVAWRWYQSRVVFSGPEEYCRQLYLTSGEDVDPANVSKEIQDCDKAIGYERAKTGKPKID